METFVSHPLVGNKPKRKAFSPKKCSWRNHKVCKKCLQIDMLPYGRTILERMVPFSQLVAKQNSTKDDLTSQTEEKTRKEIPKTRIIRRNLPLVAIVGRPNVGKSTLLNRLTRDFRFGAIAVDVPGITRDRTYHRAFWNGIDFELVDTGGLVFDEGREQVPFLKEIREQALIALNEATAAIFVVDSTVGVADLDRQIAKMIRRLGLPVLLAVNKCDDEQRYLDANEFWKLGLGEPFPVSGIHGIGTGDLLDKLVEYICERGNVFHEPYLVDERNVRRIAIVGRPNAGKSSILNRLVGETRAIVSDIPGTTRDTIDTTIQRDEKIYCLMDTAGIRRKKMVEYGTEFFMINRAFKAIRRADLVILVVDAVADIVEQDEKLAERIVQEGRGCIILMNKWDLVQKDEDTYEKAKHYVQTRLAAIDWAPCLFVSATTGQRCEKVYELIESVYEQYSRRVSTSVLNQVLEEAIVWNPPSTNKQGKQGKIYYCTQVSSKPPTITLFVNEPKLFKENYKRYIENYFRKSLGFKGTPLRFLWRGKKRPPPI
ncbi:GTP-binding protein [Galdieria sulphuraria]|uniref:GTPase Der n=1 Tax=Galdieria sulphuraria TaxID=130081 RepID=M2W7X2_GALSU|nr:GTP-binding protein [Galdieria sulphuraria]EME31931.1 GTP-binding protein [Galdieria sulphuraria]|eukprot:XP_005708451.1 GTP-binding protein [Galdieria sulphuraria]